MSSAGARESEQPSTIANGSWRGTSDRRRAWVESAAEVAISETKRRFPSCKRTRDSRAESMATSLHAKRAPESPPGPVWDRRSYRTTTHFWFWVVPAASSFKKYTPARSLTPRASADGNVMRCAPGTAGPFAMVRTSRPDRSYKPSVIRCPARTLPGIVKSTVALGPEAGLGHGADREIAPASGRLPTPTG